MVIAKESPLKQALGLFQGLYDTLALPPSVASTVREIRLRAGKQTTVEYDKGRFSAGGRITQKQLEGYMQSLCGYSVYSCEQQLRDGCITLKGGHRAGFCGTAVLKGGCLDTVRDISSINIRIAREHIGCGEEAAVIACSEGFTGLLIAGKPMSGKTTMLRDVCRILSQRHKVAVIDSRGEIAACCGGVPQLDVGPNTDVLNGYEKSHGMSLAVRVLSPEFAACDEITGDSEEITHCLHFGVKPVLTVHCGSIEEAMETPAVKSGAISHVILLGTGGSVGRIIGAGCPERGKL